MNQFVVEAVQQIIEYINQENEFRVDKIEITTETSYWQKNYKVSAFDGDKKPFKYAWYVYPDGNIIADGY